MERTGLTLPNVGAAGVAFASAVIVTTSSRFTLALLACVVVAVMAYAVVGVRGELARSEADLVEHEAATGNGRPIRRLSWRFSCCTERR
jgi:hypothetical protein